MRMIRFRCPSGHTIRAELKYAGKRVSCPKCHQEFTVPRLAGAEHGKPKAQMTSSREELLREAGLQQATATPDEPALSNHDTVTDAGVFRFLDQLDQREVPLHHRQPRKYCPRCNQLVDSSARVCTNCHVYLGITDQQWHNTLERAAQEVVENPMHGKS